MTTTGIILLVTALLLIISGLFCLVRTRNIIRLILGIEVTMKAITLLFLFAGRINGNLALAESFMISIIVAEVIVAVVAAGIAIKVYRLHGSMDINFLNKLKG